MKELLQDNCVALAPVLKRNVEEPKAYTWKALFEILLG
jgi:hypothetical protein